MASSGKVRRLDDSGGVFSLAACAARCLSIARSTDKHLVRTIPPSTQAITADVPTVVSNVLPTNKTYCTELYL